MFEGRTHLTNDEGASHSFVVSSEYQTGSQFHEKKVSALESVPVDFQTIAYRIGYLEDDELMLNIYQ